MDTSRRRDPSPIVDDKQIAFPDPVGRSDMEPRISIPLIDLGIQQEAIADLVVRGWARIVAANDFVLAEDVRLFEEEYADFSGVRHCIGVGNGTDALELALRASGISSGDEVILPANTFVASAAAVVRAGATPVLADVDPIHQLIDPDCVSDRMSPRTRAIVAVHLFGQVAPIERLCELTAPRVVVIEDAAQAHGAKRNGVAAGGFGAVTGTSFYPGKNLGAYGDAGAVLTDDAELAQRVRKLRNHGSTSKYHHDEIGFNSRLDSLQAVVLSAKLPFLPDWNEARRRAATRYDELLGEVTDVSRPRVLPGNEHVWHQYVVRVPGRDAVLGRLLDAGIGASVHYPTPIHLQGAFAFLGHQPGDFPVAEALSREILSLPIFPGITSEQQQRVVAELRRSLREP